jgi:hypothetical protein
VISLDQQQRRIVLSLKDHLATLDEEDDMSYRAEVQRRAAERKAKAEARAAEGEAPQAGRSGDPDESAFEEIERSLSEESA